jgi:hypothetical protein
MSEHVKVREELQEQFEIYQKSYQSLLKLASEPFNDKVVSNWLYRQFKGIDGFMPFFLHFSHELQRQIFNKVKPASKGRILHHLKDIEPLNGVMLIRHINPEPNADPNSGPGPAAVDWADQEDKSFYHIIRETLESESKIKMEAETETEMEIETEIVVPASLEKADLSTKGRSPLPLKRRQAGITEK